MTMELREFAERVLFATTLEDKLSCPATITDGRPGTALIAPAAPGRPAELRFKEHTGKAEFPGAHRLERERERGLLLHFFANHELLAVELMALVLLKFPEAPAAFRRGVLRTLQEEQEHTRLYLRRMAECGIQFGELPVSGYFWRSVAGMQSPMDYVAGLSLTFEQANLDYCRQFAGAFAAAGDGATARLLERIYRDEIGHVAYGLKWFRRWKNPGESDWEAFCRQLKYPLSPQRAKGVTLNVEGRRAAGLDETFINELSVYSQSRGRTPVVFVFNPFVELWMARGRSFTPAKHQAALARDLANLPQFLCRQDDVVLVPKKPSLSFLSAIQQAGFPLPEFVELKGQRIEESSGLHRRKLGGLRPWAWGPDAVELLEPLFANVTGEQITAGGRYNEKIAHLYSKSWSVEFLRRVIAKHRESVLAHSLTRSSRGNEAHSNSERGTQNSEQSQSLLTSAATMLRTRSEPPWLCGEQEVGEVADTLEETLAAVEQIRRSGHHKVVVKQAFGLAGHDMIRLWEPGVQEKQRRWVERALDCGHPLVVEPWLERVLDFSVQLEMTRGGLKLCGYTGLLNDPRGQFQANRADSTAARRMPGDLPAAFLARVGLPARFYGFYRDVFAQLEGELAAAGYFGPLGIDAFIYRASDGSFRLKPIVEINLRYTMGRLTLELMKRVCPGSVGIFRLVNRATARAEGFGSFVDYARALTARAPLRLAGAPVPRIAEGELCLNDPGEAQEYLAVFRVGRNLPPGRALTTLARASLGNPCRQNW
jgi:uncharacterized ferritin-like protein (DUF455 family)